MKHFYLLFLLLFGYNVMSYAAVLAPLYAKEATASNPIEKRKVKKRKQKQRLKKIKHRQTTKNKISKKKAMASIIGGVIIFLIGIAALSLFLWFVFSGGVASLILLIGAILALGTGGILIVMGIINYKKALKYEEEKIKLG